jgi:prephenate dehydratase
LTTKSSTLDTTVIQEQNMKIQLTVAEAEENLKAIEEKLKTPWQSLDSAQQALSRRELSSSMVISSSVANAMALMKNHLLNLDVEILCKNFTVDDTEREALANNAYDAAHDFVSMYDISSLAESDDNNSPGAL